jgi:type III restriction enzyme
LGLKKTFENSEIYKRGLIFLNEQEEIKPIELELGAEVRKKIYTVDLFSGKTTTSKVFKDEEDTPTNNNDYISKGVKVLKMRELGVNVVQKALHQINGFEFNLLQEKFPKLESYAEFITSDRYLSNIEIHLTGGAMQLENISQEDKLRIAKQVLNDLHIIGSSEVRQFRGTKVFKALTLRSVIKEKVVNFAISNEENGKAMSSPISTYHDKDILSADWYAFTDCYGTSEEKALVKFMKAKQEELKATYDEFYLVRNERHFAIYEFEQGRRFEPDFALFLKKKNEDEIKHYQLFIEPKGEHLMREDRWKEQFLIRLHDEASVEKTALNNSKEVNAIIEKFWAADNFTVWGLPFYNEKEYQKSEFNNRFADVLT